MPPKKAPEKKVSPKKTSKSSNQPVQPPKIVDKSYKNDRAVEIRGSIPLNAVTVAQLQRGLMLQAFAKNGGQSTLKFYMGPADANRYKYQDQAALADVMVLVPQAVDTIIRSAMGPDLLKGFLSATGKRYMTAGAQLYLGPVMGTTPYGKNKASQVRRQLYNDYFIDLQTLVMDVSGEKNRTKVFRDLLSAKGYNPMEALAYGKKGLIDGILMEADHVITRADLDAYVQQKKLTGQDLQEFLKHYINVYKLPKRHLAKLSPWTLPTGTDSFYQSLKKPMPPKNAEEKPAEDAKKEDQTKDLKAKTVAEDKPQKKASLSKKHDTPEKPEEKKDEPIFYIGEKKLDEWPLMMRASKEKSPRRIMIENLNPSSTGILADDVIFFNDGFKDETAEQIADALVALDHKKAQQKQSSHIKILENSPGGSVWSGQELRSLIRSLQTPVDVLVVGMGASCGSWLLSSATGNRFATPHARIMFHEAATEVKSPTPQDHLNEAMDDLDQATLDYIAIVAEAVGRPFEEVLIDFDHDVWLNPLESLFYGEKGMIDAILVNPNQVITKAEAEAFLIQKLGSKAKAKAYVERKLLEKRDPRQGMAWKPDSHDEADFFENPVRMIAQIAKTSAKSMAKLKPYQRSLPVVHNARTIDYFNVVIDEEKK